MFGGETSGGAPLRPAACRRSSAASASSPSHHLPLQGSGVLGDVFEVIFGGVFKGF